MVRKDSRRGWWNEDEHEDNKARVHMRETGTSRIQWKLAQNLHRMSCPFFRQNPFPNSKSDLLKHGHFQTVAMLGGFTPSIPNLSLWIIIPVIRLGNFHGKLEGWSTKMIPSLSSSASSCPPAARKAAPILAAKDSFWTVDRCGPR